MISVRTPLNDIVSEPGVDWPLLAQQSEAMNWTTTAVGLQLASQVSPVVQAFPSLHAVPLGSAGLVQRPVVGLHVPAA
jgi:hypothetical protein